MTGEVSARRVWAQASHETFQIPPIRDLVARYVDGGRGWADPYARNAKIAQWTNDMDPSTSARFHLDALEFVRSKLPARIEGAVLDPPYSYRQISEHYRAVGKRPTGLDTSFNFYYRVMRPLARKIRKGGIAITFGWNSNGFPRSLGFEKVEVLVVAHGGHHNDTICVVDRKVK